MQRITITGPATEQELIEREIQATLAFHEEHLRITIANAISGCESPVERVLMAAFVAHNDATPGGGNVVIYGRGRKYADIGYIFDGLHLFPQVVVDGYRLDFLAIEMFEGRLIRHTVIEVDGHDFHERTKKQASHDKRRDRFFTAKGWQVVRYTGSDVWRDPSACAREALSIAEGVGDEL